MLSSASRILSGRTLRPCGATATRENPLASIPLHYLDLSGQLALDRPMLFGRVNRPSTRLVLGHAPRLAQSARRPYPGDDFALPYGVARTTRAGDAITIVTWGAMVERCEAAADGVSADIIDLRTLAPCDRDAVLASVKRTHRCLIVHEDNFTAGFGAEIAATLAKDAFFSLDAPIERLTMPDIPSPHSPVLLEAAVPTVARITDAIKTIASV